MARSVSTTTILNVFKVFVYFQVALFITLTRGYVISTSSFRLTLFVTVLVLTFLSPAHAEKDLSLFEFFVTILTSTSSFVISESPVIVILILTDSSLISNIKPRLERFLVNRSSSSSTSLVTSNNIRRYAECFWLNTGLISNVRFELPPEIIGEIVNRLHTFRDFIAVAGVSRTWRSVCLSISRRPQLPWLMLSETLSTDMRHFFSLCDNNRYQLQLSVVQGKRCWGSPHGWVVTLGPDYETHLLHLIKRVQIALPPSNTIRTLAATEEWFRLVHKFILLKDPSQDSSLLVIAIFGPENRLAFARVAFDRRGEGAALNRRGQGQWAIVTNPDNLKFNDVACFNDQIYGLCDNGKLVRLELDAPLAAELQVIAPQPSEEEVGMPQKLYLVETSENLYGIFRYGFHIPSKMRHKTIYFLVYKLNFGALAWEEVTDLEDIAVFVGEGNSWCIPTSTILCRSNCIYFTDDNWEWQRYPGVAYGGHDVGVFNMAQRVIQRLPFAICGGL
ncbi:putative F-box protein At5g60060 isoform X1 [Quercus lobata]|uniref:putative F-box protein At5g60060 isoform X1 n=1 Tax=Quercus lobata TaxID=97700 RepID=UPI001244113B|nr:putative F-box protein At5g60060 isoform X1 [Quercus lobata]